MKKHVQALFFIAFWPLFCVPTLALSLEADPIISGPLELFMRTSIFTEEEYQPDIGTDEYIWSEKSWYVQTRISIRPRTYLSLGWLDSTIEQENKLENDIDFHLNNRAPIMGFGIPMGSAINLRGQVSLEKYSNASLNVFYPLEKTTTLATGNIEASLTAENMWASVSFKRERDTEQVYDEAANDGQLFIRAQELAGLAVSLRPSPQFELGSSVYYEWYDTELDHQLNINAGITYNPVWSKALSFSLGGSYFTEEKETLINMNSVLFIMKGPFDLSLEWYLEFSDIEQSVLNQVQAFMKYYAGKHVSCYFQGEFGQETGDDKDRLFTFNAGLEFVF